MQESSAYFPRLFYRCIFDLLRAFAAKLAHLSLHYLIQFYLTLSLVQ